MQTAHRKAHLTLRVEENKTPETQIDQLRRTQRQRKAASNTLQTKARPNQAPIKQQKKTHCQQCNPHIGKRTSHFASKKTKNARNAYRSIAKNATTIAQSRSKHTPSQSQTKSITDQTGKKRITYNARARKTERTNQSSDDEIRASMGVEGMEIQYVVVDLRFDVAVTKLALVAGVPHSNRRPGCRRLPPLGRGFERVNNFSSPINLNTWRNGGQGFGSPRPSSICEFYIFN